jgi:hypothetical protein
MFLIRIALGMLGMKKVCFVYIFKYNRLKKFNLLRLFKYIKVYLNLEIGVNICIINNPDKCEIYTIRKPTNSFSENCMGFGPYRPLVMFRFLNCGV